MTKAATTDAGASDDKPVRSTTKPDLTVILPCYRSAALAAASVKRLAGGTGLSTRFSIAYGYHALGLGPANPTRTYLASEPSGFRRWGFPPHLSLVMPASALPLPPPALTR